MYLALIGEVPTPAGEEGQQRFNWGVADGRIALGRRAEEAVAGLLASRGARILARNHRPRGGGEVDIIALDGGTLRFVEVKARRRGRPRDLVTWEQQQRLEASIDLWLASHPHEGPVTLEMALMTVDGEGLVEEIDFVPLA